MSKISLLDHAGGLCVSKKAWHYENEPKNLKSDEYTLQYTEIHGIPYWEESDESFRRRIKQLIAEENENKTRD